MLFHIVVGRSGDTVPVNGFLANLANGGYAAVTFFFILSGFILTYAHAGNSESDPLDIKTKTFWKLRIARILPAYLLGLVLALPILIAFLRILSPLEALAAPLLVVSFLQAWYPPLSEVWNYPAWSLSVEVLFYVSFPWLFLAFTRLRRPWLFLIAYALVLISAVIRTWVGDNLSHHFPLFHLPLFIFGMALGRQFLFGRIASIESHAVMFVVGLLALIALFGFRSLPPWTRCDAVLVLVFSSIIFGGARPAGAMALLSVPAMVLLGEASYSIYILHVPLRLLWDDLKFGLPLWLNLPLYFAALVVFSVFSFRCVETPLRKLISNWRPTIPARPPDPASITG